MMYIIYLMRHSREDKIRSHERIVEVAARRIRESGTEAPSVAEIMETAGMTHGGFYKHFGSRDELVAEATERACADGSHRLSELTGSAENPLEALVATYLSAEHRDDPGTGCAVAALSGDAARAGNPARAALTRQVVRYVDRLQGLLPPTGGDGDSRDQALTAMSTLVGALMISRSVDDPTLADDILRAARIALTTVADQAQPPGRSPIQ
jgi:TetR/AcrR family transcriptional repressor of nem operon